MEMNQSRKLWSEIESERGSSETYLSLFKTHPKDVRKFDNTQDYN